MKDRFGLPVAIIGAGPIGLAAAAHLAHCGASFVVLEAGPSVGHSVRQWGHVTMVSPWKYNVDAIARQLLLGSGWQAPDEEQIPTGIAWLEQYLAPLASLPALRPHIHLNTTVSAVTRENLDKASSEGRSQLPFTLRLQDNTGNRGDILAHAVIDASGTWGSPNPAGANGIAAIGEAAVAEQIRYGIPDILNAERVRYAGKRVFVVGNGHTALDALHGLAALKRDYPDTTIIWGIRRERSAAKFANVSQGALPALAALRHSAGELVEAGVVELMTSFQLQRLSRDENGLLRIGARRLGYDAEVTVDELIVATGFRPDFSHLREIRLDIDSALESAAKLASLIAWNLQSRAAVPAHGAALLEHPEKHFYIAGMKSYGRAPTFSALIGYEQVRSIVAQLVGDYQEELQPASASTKPTSSAPDILSRTRSDWSSTWPHDQRP